MTTETRDVTNNITTRQLFYIAVDNKAFESRDECKEYEDALKIVLGAELIPTFKIVSENKVFDGWFGSEEWYYATVKVTEGNYDKLRMFAVLNSSDLKTGYEGTDGEVNKFTKDCIGKTVMFGIGDSYSDTAVNEMYYYGTVNEWYAYMTNAMLKALES